MHIKRSDETMKRILFLLLATFAIHAVAATESTRRDGHRFTSATVERIDVPGSYPEVFISGYIERETVARFKDLGYLHSAGVGLVFFDSPGGDLLAAMELGQLIRERGFSTRVGRQGQGTARLPGRCESACPFAFAGGRFRFLEADSKLGLHQFISSGGDQANDLKTGQVVSTMIANHLTSLGISVSVMERMVSADNGSMAYLTPVEAFDLGLVNAGTLPAQWQVKDVAGAVALVGEQERIQGTGKLALACAEGDGVELTAMFKAWYSPSLAQALNEATIVADGKQVGGWFPVPFSRTRNGYVSFTFRPNPEQLRGLVGAQSIGIKYSKSGTEVRAGFEVDARDSAALIRSFVNLCKGHRPSLAGP